VAGDDGRFVWYELITTDKERAKAFYSMVLGWGTQDVSIPSAAYSLFTLGDTSVSGLMNLPTDADKIGAKPRWIGYVGVKDVDATAVLINQLGGAMHVPPTNFDNFSRFAVAVDPQTATFGLISWLRPIRLLQAELNIAGRVAWHELLAADREKALAFYSSLFGWQKKKPEWVQGALISCSPPGRRPLAAWSLSLERCQRHPGSTTSMSPTLIRL